MYELGKFIYYVFIYSGRSFAVTFGDPQSQNFPCLIKDGDLPPILYVSLSWWDGSDMPIEVCWIDLKEQIDLPTCCVGICDSQRGLPHYTSKVRAIFRPLTNWTCHKLDQKNTTLNCPMYAALNLSLRIVHCTIDVTHMLLLCTQVFICGLVFFWCMEDWTGSAL